MLLLVILRYYCYYNTLHFCFKYILNVNSDKLHRHLTYQITANNKILSGHCVFCWCFWMIFSSIPWSQISRVNSDLLKCISFYGNPD